MAAYSAGLFSSYQAGGGGGFVMGFWPGGLVDQTGEKMGCISLRGGRLELLRPYTTGIPFQGISWTQLSFS